MWIILGVLFSSGVFALAPYENLKNVKILKFLPENIVVLDRGAEDGIQRHNHAKISHDEAGFGSRAICLMVYPEKSIWKIYRVPHSETFSLDYTYSLIGLADREIPKPQINIRDREFHFDEKKESESSTIKSDLPEKI